MKIVIQKLIDAVKAMAYYMPENEDKYGVFEIIKDAENSLYEPKPAIEDKPLLQWVTDKDLKMLGEIKDALSDLTGLADGYENDYVEFNIWLEEVKQKIESL
jgi:hypothetical protein